MEARVRWINPLTIERFLELEKESELIVSLD